MKSVGYYWCWPSKFSFCWIFPYSPALTQRLAGVGSLGSETETLVTKNLGSSGIDESFITFPPLLPMSV